MENPEQPQRRTPDPATAAGPGAAPVSAADRARPARPAARPRPDRSLAGLPSDVELFPIRTVSSLTGVNAITLRAWERRYGLVRPVRTPTGHRLYRRDEIDLIHRVVGLLGKGVSIGQVQRVLSQRSPAAQGEGSDESPFWARHRRRMVSAIARFDEETLEAVYHEVLGVCATGPMTERLLVPVAADVGRARDTAEGSAHERFFGAYLRSKLGARFLHQARGLDGRRLLGAPVPGEYDEIGLLLFALSAHEVGLRSVLLGANTPLNALKAAANPSRCEAIVLSGSAATPADVFAEPLAKLVRDVVVPVYVHGPVSIHRHDQVVAAGGIPLGNDPIAAARRVCDGLQANKA